MHCLMHIVCVCVIDLILLSSLTLSVRAATVVLGCLLDFLLVDFIIIIMRMVFFVFKHILQVKLRITV